MSETRSNPQGDKVTGMPILDDESLTFEHPREDVHTAVMSIAGCGWVDTGDGVVLIDTLFSQEAAKKTLDKIHEISGKIEYIIYTHGHLDHVSGCEVFMADQPREVIANKYLPARLDKYKMLGSHRMRIGVEQFNISPAEVMKKAREVVGWVYPTKTFMGQMTISLGDKTFELHTARAETDDACWVWIPEIKTAFVGDLVMMGFPNIGNPWKPTRFTLGWVKALEEVRAKEPELLLCNGAGFAYHGAEALDVLDAHIEAIRSLHDQVVDCINQGMHITEMIHAVKLPPHLADNPCLQFIYSRPEFFVFNTYRWYHGYFDGNPAHLLPRPEREVNQEIFDLIGDPQDILDRAGKLFAQGQAQLGLQVLDVLLQAEPENVAARKLRIEMLQELGSQDYCLMSRNAWVHFIDKDREFLRSRGGK